MDAKIVRIPNYMDANTYEVATQQMFGGQIKKVYNYVKWFDFACTLSYDSTSKMKSQN